MVFVNLILDKRMKTNEKSRPRLILLTQYYDPEPAYKGQAFAEAIGNLGYDVEVVTGFPNYPGGKVYDGYRIRPIHRSVQNDIRITRLAIFPSHSASKLGRIVNYISFFISAFCYLCWAGRRASIVYAYHPPLTVGLAAAASQILHRAPVVVDIHDLWPDTLPATGMISNTLILKWIEKIAFWMYRRVQFIILHTEGFRARLLERGVPADKMKTVIGWTHERENLSDEKVVKPQGLELLESAKGLRLLYAGNMGPAQALETVIGAADKLQQAGNADLVTFCFLGDGISRASLLQEAERRNLRNVLFIPRVASQEVAHFLYAADALLVHLRADPLFEITLPSKTQAYMFAGKPILMAVNGEAAALIEAAKAGVSSKPQDVDSIVGAAMALAKMTPAERSNLGEAGQQYYNRELSMVKGLEHLAHIFELVRKPSHI
jgi:glycosyltransferase involved in cell wall biosynthesis